MEGTGIDVPPDPVVIGIGAGLTRAGTWGLPVELPGVVEDLPGALGPEFEEVYSVVRRHQEESSERFVALAAELVTVGQLARRAYGEPPVHPGEVESFVGHARDFLNSFSHR